LAEIVVIVGQYDVLQIVPARNQLSENNFRLSAGLLVAWLPPCSAISNTFVFFFVSLPASIKQTAIKLLITLISGFRRDVDVICGLLGNYTASCGIIYISES
jgi:hypothetical protein